MASSAASMVLLANWQAWVFPLWIVVVGALGAMLLLVGVYLVLGLVFPKVAAIARTTARQGWTSALFWLLAGVGTAWLLLSVFLPYHTLGEDIKVVKEGGLESILVLATILAVWTASVAIANELEGRTALTLLSKPVSRRHFVLGKFLGVLAPVFTLFVILGVVFLSTISYKTVYDARESSRQAPTQADCQGEMVQSVPALALSFLAVVVMASISVALSTRLAMIPNLLICIAIFGLGRLAPPLVQSAELQQEYPLVGFVARLIATILPALEHFNVERAIADGRAIPVSYLVTCSGYCIVFSTLAVLLALFLFEDRDLA